MPPLFACRLVSPPYVASTNCRAVPCLGTIMVWHLDTSSDALALVEAHSSAPWCSLVVEVPLIDGWPDRNALFDSLTSVACLPVFMAPGENAAAAVRNRRPPEIAEITRFVTQRPGYEKLGAHLQQLVRAEKGGSSARSFRRHVSLCSRFSPRHWKWVIQLARIKLLPGESAEALAGRYQTDVRTLRHRIRTCLDVSLDQFRQLVGWEWRVEAALRLDARKRAESGGGRINRS